jgi:catalase
VTSTPAPDQRPVPPANPAPGDPIEQARWAQTSDQLTTANGLALPDTDHSLKAGARGPSLLEDHHLREKITHFDHERIPERVVHARGAGAHGVFRSYGTAAPWTRARFLAEADVQTPVFVRFSTVVGSRGSADTVRDVRGFAVKFYTEEGVFDLVGNNIPVFFIQDGIKFPDVIHAAKPHPDREIPQAQTAHDTFWDFASLHTETTHMLMWVMSDRAIPRSYRMMEGFGVHTFRLVGSDGGTHLVKFHWKPAAGVHSLIWEEAQLAAGVDPDFHRRDLADAIDSGALPEWELGVQVMPDTPEQTFEGIDLLDPTKIVPEELVPVQPIGRLTLTANPSNYFAETEQVAFHVGHLVPGIEVTDDPLIQARLFSYLDTQLTRLGGPNFGQLPINRTHAPVNDMLRDGMHQTAIHSGIAPYRPNSLDGGLPEPADGGGPGQARGYVHVPREVGGPKVRANPAGFADHFTQARLFWVSMSPVEQAHIVSAFTFELGKCASETVRSRMVANLARIDPDLCARVAAGLGLSAPTSSEQSLPDVTPSPALSQLSDRVWPASGRVVGVLVADGADFAGVETLRTAVGTAGGVVRVIARHGGRAVAAGGELAVDRALMTTRSVEYDALAVGPGVTSLTGQPELEPLLTEAFRHGKPMLAWGDGAQVLAAVGLPTSAPGVILGDQLTEELAGELLALIGRHRIWDRTAVTV